MIVPMIMIQQNAIHIVLRSDTRRCPQFGQRKARFETTCPHAGHGFSSFGFPAGGFGRMSCPHTGQTVARLLISLPQAGQDLSHVASCVPICFSFVVCVWRINHLIRVNNHSQEPLSDVPLLMQLLQQGGCKLQKPCYNPPPLSQKHHQELMSKLRL